MNFISIVPFFPNDIDYTVRESRHALEASGVRRNAYSMTMQPEGTDVMAKPKLCAKAFRQITEQLKGDGIQCGILIQSTIGHGWADANTCERDWMETINIKGVTLHRLCMLDPNVRAYTRDMIKMLAAEKPAFFLIDDDLRAINNSSNGPECFCDLHMAEFNKRSSQKLTREQLIEKIKTAPWDDSAVRLFEQIRRETILGYAKLIRGAIDEVDASIPCGYCSGGGEYLLAGDIARTLAGKNESFLRINNAAYNEMSAPVNNFYSCMFQTAFKVAAAGKLDSILDESDIFPHNAWSKSAISMHAHITGGILNGVSGGKLWISDLINKCDIDIARHRAILKKHLGFYNTLLQEVNQLRWQGPNTVLRDPAFRFHPGFALKYLEAKNWSVSILDPLGLPSHYGKIEKTSINTLTADTVDALSDEELKTVLSGKALIDGGAALKLAERGFVSYLGVKPKDQPFKTRGETLNGSQYKCRLLNTGSPFLTDLDPKAVPLSKVDTAPYRYAPTEEYVMPGAVFFENAFGGKVITTALSVKSNISTFYSHSRKQWAIALLQRLDPASLPLYANALQHIYFRCGIRPDGNLLAAFYNLSYDSLDEISLTSLYPIRKVEILQGDGAWKEVAFKQNDKKIIIDKNAVCQEFIILKLIKK